MGNHFGNTPGACQEGPFEFQYIYTCTGVQVTALPTCIDDANGFAANAPCIRDIDPDGPGPSGIASACVYRPGAQIKDNWDWCNCSGPGCEIPGGAYGDDCDPTSAVRLNSTGSNASSVRMPWSAFQGEVRVFPAPGDTGIRRRPFGVFDTVGGVFTP
jgi:hypothetical protein